MILTKYQALGNDYWIYDPSKNAEILTPELVKKLCNRHYGLGGDGILVGPKSNARDNFSVDIYNADGTLAEISGNGLTIFSRYLWDEHKVESNTFFCIHSSKNCSVKTSVYAMHRSIVCEIFFQKFNVLEEIGFSIPKEILMRYPIPSSLKLIRVDMGNPHCVVPVKNPTKALACDLGRILEVHPLFPQKTNVQFVDWNVDQHFARMEIWERGSGYTLGSGSSAGAVACAYGYYFSLNNYRLNIQMPGGNLEINHHKDGLSFINQAFKIADIEVKQMENEKMDDAKRVFEKIFS